MIQPIISQVGGLATSAGTNYGILMGFRNDDSAESDIYEIMPTAGILDTLYCELSAAPGGVGKTHTIAISINGSIVGYPVVVITNAATTGSDLVNHADVVAGDTVSYQIVTLSTPAAANLYASCYFTGSTAGESILLGCTAGDVLNVGANEYAPLANAAFAISATQATFLQLIATPGTLKKLYVLLSIDPGTGPDAYRFTILHDGTTTTGTTCTITADNTAGNDVANSHAVAAGSDVTLYIEYLNTPSATPTAAWGCVFVSDTDGESLLLGGSGTELDDTATEYNFLSALGGSWGGTEATLRQLCNACTLKNLYVELSGSPGTGNSYTFSVRVEDGSPANTLSVQIAAAATTGNDTTNTVTVSAGNTVNLMVVPASTPTVRVAYWGLVAYIETVGIFYQEVGDGVITPSGSLGLKIGKGVGAGAITPTGALGRNIFMAVGQGVITPIGALNRAIKAFLVGQGSITPSGTLSAILKYFLSVGQGAITPVGTLGRKIMLAVGSGSITPAGVLGLLIKIAVGAGSITPVGALGTIKRFLLTVGEGAITPIGELGRKIMITVGAGSITPVGVLGRLIKITMGGGAITPTGTLARKIFLQMGQGMITPIGTLGRKIMISVGGGTITPIGAALGKLIIPKILRLLSRIFGFTLHVRNLTLETPARTRSFTLCERNLTLDVKNRTLSFTLPKRGD